MTIDAQRHSDEMAAQRARELAGDDRHYRLRKACQERAMELHRLLTKSLEEFAGLPHSLGYDITHMPAIDQLLKEIEHDAQ